jgi:ornithine cyclodeaminase
VTAIGSDGPDKQELEVAVLAGADLVVVDSREQCAKIGELHHALDAETVHSPDDVVELGEVTAGLRPGRTSEGQLTVCDLTGVGVQDVAAANVVMSRAGDAGEVIGL